MPKKIVIGVVVVVVVAVVGGFFWVRAVLTGDSVRTSLAAQVSAALGQPVTIGSLSATAYPRVTVHLSDVRIGEPARLQVGELNVGTNFRALLSRRIEHATLRLSGARIDLPLPPFKTTEASGSAGGAETSQARGSSPVELVSIDEIVLNDVQITSGGRTLRGDVELVPQGKGVLVRKIALRADDTTMTVDGEITDLSGPTGEFHVKASALGFERLMAFVNDFSGGAGLGAPPPASGASKSTPQGAATPRAGMNLVISIEADRAAMGTLVLDKLAGRARVTARAMTLDPVDFGVFGGRYKGSLVLTSEGGTLNFRADATLTGIDVAAATRFAGSPDTISGRMSGRLNFTGRGSDPAAVARSTRGTARLEIADGIVKNLGLISSVVVATSMRSGATNNLGSGSKDEPFSKLGATLNIANGAVTTNDLLFESKDLSLAAQGTIQLSAATVDLKGRMQLSEALSQQAGRDLVRYTQEQGRVTVPATITGPAAALHVSIDTGDLAKRAVVNAVSDKAKSLLKGKDAPKGLSGLFGR